MKTRRTPAFAKASAGRQNLIAAALVSALAFTTTQAQQYPNPTTAAEVPGPAAGNTMTKEYVQMVGRMAYFCGWPLVANFNRSVAFTKVPEPGLVGGVVPIAYGGTATPCYARATGAGCRDSTGRERSRIGASSRMTPRRRPRAKARPSG